PFASSVPESLQALSTNSAVVTLATSAKDRKGTLKLALVQEIVDLDDLVAARPHTNSGDAAVRELLNGLDVVLCRLGQVAQLACARDVFAPTGQGFVDGLGRRERTLIQWQVLVTHPVDVVGHAHGDFLKPSEHVQLGEHNVG